MKTYKQFVDHVYNLVRIDTIGMDAVYGDHITTIVGSYGFNALYDENLIECCGLINGRKIYVLCKKEDDNVKEENY